MPTHPASPLERLTDDDLDAIARELDAIGDAVRADLGEPDAAYIRRVIALQRALEASARILLFVTRSRSAAVGGAALLTTAKILDNLAIGHNVMHGQWDWMRDPQIHSTTWEWDAPSTAASWKHSHNYQHHTYTNIVGKDRDLGYSAIRVHPDQPWHPVYLLQPLYGIALALIFEWAIAIYDMELDAVRDGRKTASQAKSELRAFARKAARQLAKDYVLFPAVSGRRARRTLLANLSANVLRSAWTHTIVFMGHLPEEAETFPEQQLEGESRGGWYVRQLLGSCNLDGRRPFHLMTGHLSFQIEHHLFPDVACHRYPEIAPRVRAVCERYDLPYASGPLGRQYRSVAKKILRYALP
ncbi:NADPH-dependent stearoyl-CoA 9-desaturase [Baekduia alba]|uniref:fatty acid desaturase family protein n=1 Tax=Baekduia alba TaxID=2997333 RepID=UPI002341C809|nr:acyl-CoA desaturase [Baekduia alba]WCB95938.1 NADPH-dependent stearoyl-CoA 9-desaturase [Baekduia alba]